MFKIIYAQFLAPGMNRFVIDAPRIARKQKPGQFVILRIYEEGERIPVTIEKSDPEKGFQEHLNGVYSANEFLTRINLMKAYRFPVYDEPMLDLKGKNVAGVGGGNAALDAIRSALRLGAGRAYVIYRRSAAEMPARAEEAHHAQQEGIDFQMLTAPVEFLSDGKGWLNAARCVRMELGEPDASGRRRPVPRAGSEFDLPLSVAIIAIGTSANPIVQSTTPDLGTNKRGYIQASEETQRTTRKGVFAGRDIATGAATVILAMGAGRRAAKSIHEYLTTDDWRLVTRTRFSRFQTKTFLF